jgi:hypothetical protein
VGVCCWATAKLRPRGVRLDQHESEYGAPRFLHSRALFDIRIDGPLPRTT